MRTVSFNIPRANDKSKLKDMVGNTKHLIAGREQVVYGQ